MVELLLPKQVVVGSIPITRSILTGAYLAAQALLLRAFSCPAPQIPRILVRFGFDANHVWL